MWKPIIGGVISAASLLLVGANFAFNWIGRSTVVDDAAHAMNLVEKAADWFFALPSWAVGLLGLLIVSAYWCWLFEPWNTLGGNISQNKGKQTKLSAPEIKPGFQKTPRQSVEVSFDKKDAPNQDNMSRNWRRVCAGIILRNVNPNYPISLKMRVYTLDPSGWRFADKIAFDGELAVGEWVDHYPVELHMRMNNTPRLKYERQIGVMTELDEDQELQIVVELYFQYGEHIEYSFSVRTPRKGHERFVAELL